jgi:hypothetical protein
VFERVRQEEPIGIPLKGDILELLAFFYLDFGLFLGGFWLFKRILLYHRKGRLLLLVVNFIRAIFDGKAVSPGEIIVLVFFVF